MTHSFLIAGFGGQGLLFAGKYLANKGMMEGKEISWLPSYGPEMRGGTASCSVIISDTAIGSPLVPHPDILIAMNLPSLDRFEDAVVPGGMIFYDSSLIERPVKRSDVKAFCVPATKLAGEAGMPALANMIVMGKMLRESSLFPYDAVDRTIQKVVSAKRQNLVELNKKAIAMGYEL